MARRVPSTVSNSEWPVSSQSMRVNSLKVDPVGKPSETPKPDRAAWSFGPDLVKATGGRYVELDVFVPESIQDTDAWKAMPWYAHYDRAAYASATVLPSGSRWTSWWKAWTGSYPKAAS